MATAAELVRLHTNLGRAAIDHLQRLVGSWGPLADLCFADLLLVVPARSPSGEPSYLVVGQMRPTTNQTLYRNDFVGAHLQEADRPLVGEALRTGRICEGETVFSALHNKVSVLAIPVRLDGQIIAVVSRESAPSLGREPGELEAMYVEVFRRFAHMIATGEFPFATEDAETEEAPRVGDGAVVLDGDGRVEYTSPNAVSALHRIGVHANAEGMRLSELGLEEVAVRTSFAIGAPVTEEIERGPEVTVLLRCVPLLADGTVTGALLLLRDISEVRRRDRMLISMDATIREIHHRVKNNLQTISSLLRLQGRRLHSPEAKQAIEESVRRIRAIALVHETLSREVGDDVPFAEIVRPLVRMVEEGLLSPEHPVAIAVEGDAGKLPARIATPLAVVLNELLQNTVDHAFPKGAEEDGHVLVDLSSDAGGLVIRVVDNGVGLPEGFAIESSRGLGLSIVRSLVTTQIEGSIVMRSRPQGEAPAFGGPGTEIVIRVPLIGS